MIQDYIRINIYTLSLKSLDRIEVFLLADHTVGGRKRPEDACREDTALVGVLHQRAIAGHLSIKTTVFQVDHIVEPETQDIVLEGIEEFFTKGRHCYKD